MSIKDTVQNLLGGSDDADETSTETPDEPPTHRCESCGEEYYADPEMEIDTCRSCGGVKIERL